ncbi:hypothetical protein BGX21_000943 [Mortierella sp. AD011]|nr:hypothetical protein BGX20_001060 [Mortierella sp. AD010]KAF9401685.1 hypothetical protein BGX21_000943 [Mortierella sp. AD011]
MGFRYHILLTLSTTLSCLTSIHAQNLPTVTGAPAFAKVGNYFYVHSGTVYADSLVSQFIALDLTVPWTTVDPAWTFLPPGPFNAYHTAGYSADNSTFYTFGRDTGASTNVLPPYWLNSYNIKTQTWTSSNPPQVNDTSRRDFYAATNPTLNQIYIIGGDAGFAGNVISNVFDTFYPNTSALTEIPMPNAGPQGLYTYASVWVPRLESMLIVGGQMSVGVPSGLVLYNPASGTWTNQVATGSAFAYNRVSPCAASNADGSLVVVFGGFIAGAANADPNAYILDTTKWTWTTVPFGSTARGNAACTIVDDYFIVWGGFFKNPAQSNLLPSEPDALALLSLTSNTWLTSYTPSPAIASNSTTGSTSGSSNSKSAFPTGAIAGIVIGAVVVLLAIAFLVHKYNKKRHGHVKADTTDVDFTKADEGGDIAETHPSLDGRPRRPPPPPEIFTPVNYDFESVPSASNVERNSQQLLQSVHESHPGFAPHPYDQNYISPQMAGVPTSPSAEGYNSVAGYTYSPSSTAPLVPASEYSGTSPYQQHQQMQNTSFANAGNVYYPPPPGSNQLQGYIPYNPLPTNNEYKVPIQEEGVHNMDSYHDDRSQERFSMASDASSKGKRPPSGPQGGFGFGSPMGQLNVGSPQTIPE